MRKNVNEPPRNPVKATDYVGRGVAVDDSTMQSPNSFTKNLFQALSATQANSFNLGIVQSLKLPQATLAPSVENALAHCLSLFKAAHENGAKVIFIGNGGSAAIASHMAVDFTKNGGIRAIAFNDAPTLTCLGNDFGYENVFARQLGYYATAKDVVVIISSSGKSPNILMAADKARAMGCDLITFSGMRPDNFLRKRGTVNFYVPAKDYGLVELAHMVLLHSVVSLQ